MHRVAAIALLGALLLATAGQTPSAPPLAYPPAPHDATVDTYYGTTVPDPYRPLENLDAPATQRWLAAEADLTRSYLDTIPQRAAIRSYMTSILHYAAYDVPWHMRDRYFYLHNDGLQNQWVLYTMRGPFGNARILIDPNAMSNDGSVTVSDESASWDARYMAYSTRDSGSDWQTWHVRAIATGRDLPDTVRWSKFSSAAWLPDNSGFLYERYPTPAAGEAYKGALYDHAIYLHQLGTPQSSDRLFFYRPEHKDWLYEAQVTEDGRYVIVTVASNDSIDTRIGYVDLRDANRRFHELLWKNDAIWNLVDTKRPIFYFSTTLGAPNSKIVAVDIRHPSTIRTVVPESRWALSYSPDGAPGASVVGSRLILTYLTDAHSAVKIFDEQGHFIRNVALPGLGSAQGFQGFAADRVTYYRYMGWTTPSTIYRYDVVTGRSTVYHASRIHFDPEQYETKEVFYRSKDGTRVPMMISYRKGITLDGTTPAILYGYGGFDVSIAPYFSSLIATWLRMGGIYAVAYIRGGSEYGEAWHHAGMLGNKQNVFDDFIAAAQYLITQRYTSTPKLAIKGESNGGLLIGAVETQRPDLFGAALPGIGVMDMLRFDKFTIGNAWIPEYGCATCGKADFEWLYKYSPYANVKSGTTYPPTLVWTSDHDDRVFPAHSLKFAARMQAAQAGSSPILLLVQRKAAHNLGTTRAETIDLYADTYAFLIKSLDMQLPSDF